MRRRHRLRRARDIALSILALLMVLAALVINAPVLGAWIYARSFGIDTASLPAAAPFAAHDRLLLVSPHPDDEVLCCAGMILQALSAGADVWMVFMTAGDGFELDAVALERTLRPRGEALVNLGRRRIGELHDAAAVLGVPEEQVIVLGFPDRGLLDLLVRAPDAVYRSPFTGRSGVPYASAHSPGLSYTGEHWRQELRSVFELVDPTVVLAPTPLDVHPDHRATGLLVLELLAERGQLEAGRWWIVHGDSEWPLPKGVHPRQPLFPPVRARHLPWERFDLELAWVEQKLLAISAHRSQLLLLRRYMESFVKANELFSRSPLSGSPRPDAELPGSYLPDDVDR